MANFAGTRCDGCGKEVQEASPRDWIRNMVTVLGQHAQSAIQVDFCSYSCGMAYWTRRQDEQSST